MGRQSLLNKIGHLDEQVQAADWDFYLTLRKREQEIGDVRRCMVVGGSIVHHFIRATIKWKPRPFGCSHPRRMIDEKWDKAKQVRLWYKPKDIQCVSESDLTLIAHRRLKKIFKTVTVEIRRLLSWRWLLVSPSRILERYRRQFDELGGRSVPQGGI